MKRIRLTKKKIVSLAIVVALLAIVAVSTLAYYTDEVITHNIITTGAVDITLNHKAMQNGVLVDIPDGSITGIMPAAEVSRVVSVTNEQADAWIRIRLADSITAANGAALPLTLADGTPAYTLNLTGSALWDKGSDGCYYYTVPLGYKETTEVLFDGVTFAPGLTNDYQGCTVHIDVTAEAVQSANNPLPAGGTHADIPGWDD